MEWLSLLCPEGQPKGINHTLPKDLQLGTHESTTGQLTEYVHPELMLSHMLKDGCQDGEQSHRGIVNILRDAFDLCSGMGKLAELQVFQSLL